MSIFLGSRYEGQTLCRVPTPDGRKPAVFYEATFPPFRFRRHTVTAGERLDLLAYEEYGDSREWWRIAAVNWELEFFDPLVPGTVLRIPV